MAVSRLLEWSAAVAVASVLTSLKRVLVNSKSFPLFRRKTFSALICFSAEKLPSLFLDSDEIKTFLVKTVVKPRWKLTRTSPRSCCRLSSGCWLCQRLEEQVFREINFFLPYPHHVEISRFMTTIKITSSGQLWGLLFSFKIDLFSLLQLSMFWQPAYQNQNVQQASFSLAGVYVTGRVELCCWFCMCVCSFTSDVK